MYDSTVHKFSSVTPDWIRHPATARPCREESLLRSRT
jgi:hypothetical protein